MKDVLKQILAGLIIIPLIPVFAVFTVLAGPGILVGLLVFWAATELKFSAVEVALFYFSSALAVTAFWLMWLGSILRVS